MSNKATNAKEVNCADYCDALENEAWLESQKRNRPTQNTVPRKESELVASKLRLQSQLRDENQLKSIASAQQPIV